MYYLEMASTMNPASPRPQLDLQVILDFFYTEEEVLSRSDGFIDDQMLLDVRETNVNARSPVEKVEMPLSVQVDDWSTENMEDDEVQVIFANVKGPRRSQNKLTTTKAKQLKGLARANRRLAKEKESLRKELDDLKLQVAQQKSQNLHARQDQSNQVLDVLNTNLACGICSEIIIEAATIECGHIFCSYCISNWFSQQANSHSCPTCLAVTCRDPIKINNLSSTIDSLHTLLSQGAQFDREHALVDRKAEKKRARETREYRLFC